MGIKIGVVGAGSFSGDFIRLFKLHPDVDEVVIADLVPERVKQCMERYGLKRGFAGLDEMLAEAPDIDSVAIFTQRHLHGPMVIKALEAGKNVYSAVPIACEIDEIEKVIETVKRTGKVYMMGETCYYYPCAIYCRNKFKEGGFGKFVYGESQYYHDICEMYNDFKHSAGKDDWRKPAGIPPMFYPTHSISMILSALPGDYIKKVSCFGYEDHHEDAIYGNGKNYWDNPFSNETALFSLASGGVMRVNEFRRVGINKPSSYITAFYGDQGSYECSVTQHTFQRGVSAPDGPRIEYLDELINTYRYVEDKHAGTMDMTKDPCSVRYIEGFSPIQDIERLPAALQAKDIHAHYNSHPFLVDDFVRAVKEDKLPPNNAWDAARYMVPGLMAHESALKGGVLLDVPDFGDAPKSFTRLYE